ncbi:FAD-binding and (Fe-S)-binding domain-containing protein [Calderihabitans maritimus]|uniref:FAD-binding and (Fe-S)-binding domain-containing protein n=1 Tax=Calderihabitans maritimus TaxID=1246530 RepID=UPI003D16072C
MGTLAVNRVLLEKLSSLFGERVRWDKVERLLYSHDLGVIPGPVKRTINSSPDAVVQPVSADEVKELVKLAAAEKVPLVPRGSASAGYGGAVPAAGGIVVDFTRMNRVLKVDPVQQTVTVEPGVVWAHLEEELHKQGLMLRLYPTSAPGSTVAGWVAQGGAGVGSFAYGTIADNVVEVKLVDGRGEIRSFSGEDLQYVNYMEGTTGLIVEVTLRIRSLQAVVPVAVAFDSIQQFRDVMLEVRQEKLPLWSVSFQTANYVALMAEATGEKIVPSGKNLALFVYTADKTEAVLEPLKEIIMRHGGRILSEDAARHEWENRYYPMRIKKKGPSLIAAEVIVPIERVPDFLEAVAKKKNGEFAFEGTLNGPEEATLLGFMLADERKKNFPLAYSASLAVADLAPKYGGRVYSLGMYFTDAAVQHFGGDGLKELWEKKQELDPQGILNPGKVFPPSVDAKSPVKALNTAINMARKGQSLLGAASKLLGGMGGGRLAGELPEEMAEHAFICAQCGYCRSTCTVFDAQPWESNSPRGKWYILTEYLKGNLSIDEEVASSLLFCTTCKKCDVICQTDLPIAEHWLHMRFLLNKMGYEVTGLAAVRENVIKSGNFWGVPDKAEIWLREDIVFKDHGPIAYWPGCWASIVMPNMAQNITRILNKAGVEFVYLNKDDGCCGLYHALGGYEKDFAELVKTNYRRLKERGVKTLLLSCPGCFATFMENYPATARALGLEWDIETKHILVFLDELVTAGKIQFTKPIEAKVTYHDSCHVGRWFGIYEEPRRVLKAIPGIELIEMEHNRENALCCGLVAAFNSMPSVAHAGTRRIQEAVATGAQYVVTNCAGCGSQLNATSTAANAPIKQKDITDLVAEAMGIEPVLDPTESVGRYMQAAVELLSASSVRRKGKK